LKEIDPMPHTDRIQPGADRIREVYRELGRVLRFPQAFGLGHQAPKPLVEVLRACRHKLMNELKEQNRWLLEDEGTLEDELSQDAA
jgi:hypothetical protein